MTTTSVHVDQVYSYAHASSPTNNLSRKSIKELINEAARDCPSKIAFIFPKNDHLELTFSDVRQRTILLAQNLLHLGFGRGDLLAISVDNSFHVLVTFLACASIGVISAFFNQSYRLFEYEHLLAKTKAKGKIASSIQEHQQLR